jgi:hypothetical protein
MCRVLEVSLLVFEEPVKVVDEVVAHDVQLYDEK